MSIGAPPLLASQWAGEHASGSATGNVPSKRFSSPPAPVDSFDSGAAMSASHSSSHFTNPFRFSSQHDAHSSSRNGSYGFGRSSDTWTSHGNGFGGVASASGSSSSRTRTSSAFASLMDGTKGKEKEREMEESITSSAQPEPPPPSDARPSTADPSKKNRGSILFGAASDALKFGRRRKSVRASHHPVPPPASLVLPEVIEISAPKPDEEEQERQRLRDAAAQSIGLGHDILEPARSREPEEDPYDDEDRQTLESATHPESILSPSFVSSHTSPQSPTNLSHSFSTRRRAGSLALSQQSRITSAADKEKDKEKTPVIPSFPASYSSLVPYVQLEASLPKHFPPPSLLKMALSKQWKTRFVVFTSPSQPSTSNPGSIRTHMHLTSPTMTNPTQKLPVPSYLHLFKSQSAEEREVERLEINENSVVFVTDEEVGSRRSVVKVGGMDVGALRREWNGEENGQTMMLFQIVDVAVSRKWIEAIKVVVLRQRSIRAGLGVPSPNIGGTEPRGDMDVMLSMRMQHMSSSPVDYNPGLSSPNGSLLHHTSLSHGPSHSHSHSQSQSTNGHGHNHHPMSISSTSTSASSTIRSSTGASSPSTRSPNAVVTLKGLFTGSSRPRSSSRAASPSPEPDTETSESFSSAGSSLLGMLKHQHTGNGSVTSSSERAMSPVSTPIVKPMSMLPLPPPLTTPSHSHGGYHNQPGQREQEANISRKIVPNRTSLDWAPVPSSSLSSSAASSSDVPISMPSTPITNTHAALPPRSMSPSLSLQPPPSNRRRGRACTTSSTDAPLPSPTTPRGTETGGLMYNHGNTSTAGSFGITPAASMSGHGASERSGTSLGHASNSTGTPVQKARPASMSSVSTMGSGSGAFGGTGDRENAGSFEGSYNPGGSSSGSGSGANGGSGSGGNARRWSRGMMSLPKRLTPPSGSPPPVPFGQSNQNQGIYQRSHRLSHPYAAFGNFGTGDSNGSNSTHSSPLNRSSSHRSPGQSGLGVGLQVFSKRNSTSSAYSFVSTHSLPAPQTQTGRRSSSSQRTTSSAVSGGGGGGGGSNRLSVPPPQRPAPNGALPPTPHTPGTPGTPSTPLTPGSPGESPASSAHEHGSGSVTLLRSGSTGGRPKTAPGPVRSSIRDSIAKRAVRISMLPPNTSSPPSASLPPRPDELPQTGAPVTGSSTSGPASSSIDAVPSTTKPASGSISPVAFKQRHNRGHSIDSKLLGLRALGEPLYSIPASPATELSATNSLPIPAPLPPPLSSSGSTSASSSHSSLSGLNVNGTTSSILNSQTPTPTATPAPPAQSQGPKLSNPFKRLRILSAPSPIHIPLDVQIANANDQVAPISSNGTTFISYAASPPATPIGERITNMQNDPNFLLMAPTPIEPSPPPLSEGSTTPTSGMATPPQVPARSPLRPPPPPLSPRLMGIPMMVGDEEREREQEHELTSLSPPPRRGSRATSTSAGVGMSMGLGSGAGSTSTLGKGVVEDVGGEGAIGSGMNVSVLELSFAGGSAGEGKLREVDELMEDEDGEHNESEAMFVEDVDSDVDEADAEGRQMGGGGQLPLDLDISMSQPQENASRISFGAVGVAS